MINNTYKLLKKKVQAFFSEYCSCVCLYPTFTEKKSKIYPEDIIPLMHDSDIEDFPEIISHKEDMIEEITGKKNKFDLKEIVILEDNKKVISNDYIIVKI